MSEALRALLSGLIDYADLFPPASLDLPAAMRNYTAYRKGPHAWMLGRFVVPDTLAKEVDSEFPLSVLTSDKKKEQAGEITFTEVPVTEDPRSNGSPLKIRTGGATPEAYPSTRSLARFLHRAAAARIPFKATAGLHHPLYIPPDHGFVNLFLAAALMWHGGIEADALATLEAGTFRFKDDVRWLSHRLSAEQICDARTNFAMSFGSCSFEEPIEHLTRLGWM